MADEVSYIMSPEELQGVIDSIDFNFPTLFNPLEWAFEEIARKVVGWSISAAELLARFFVTVGGKVWDFLQTIFTPIYNGLRAALNWVVDMVRESANWLWEKLSALYSGTASTVGSIWDTVKTSAVDVVSSIGDTLKNWISSITNFFQQGINYLGGYYEQVANWVGDKIDSTKQFFADEVIDPWTDWLGGFTDRIEGALRDMGGEFWRGLWGMPEQFIPLTGENWQRGARSMWDWFSKEVGGLADQFWSQITEFLVEFAPISPQNAPNMAASLIKLGGVTVGGLAAMTLGGELMHPLKQLGFGNLAAVIGDVVNYRAISGIIVGAVLGTTLRTPLTYWVNELMRPQLPGLGDIMKLAGEYALVPRDRQLALLSSDEGLQTLDQENRARFRELGAFQGYTDEMLEQLYELADRGEGYFFLKAVAGSGVFDEDYFRRALANTGYNIETIKFALDMFRRSASESSQGQFATTAFTRYRQGITDGEGFKHELQVFNYPPDKLDGYLLAAQLDRETTDVMLRVNAYKNLLSSGKITPDIFRDNVIALGIDPSKINVLLQEARITRGLDFAPQDETTLKGHYASIGIGAYKEGFIDQAELTRLLETLGYEQLEIGQLILSGDFQYTIDYKNDLLTGLLAAFAKDQISESDFREGLASIGMVPDRVEGIIFREQWKKLPKVKPPALPEVVPPYQTTTGKYQINTLTEQYRADMIKEEVFLKGLLDLQMPEDEAIARVAYEYTKKLAKTLAS